MQYIYVFIGEKNTASKWNCAIQSCVIQRSTVLFLNTILLYAGFSRQEYWSGLPFPSPEDIPDPGIEPWSPTLQADALPSKPPGKS